jgi:hypothetical protein
MRTVRSKICGTSAGISKLAAEQHLQAVVPWTSLHYVILRVHNIYGPRMEFSKGRSTFVAQTIASVLPSCPSLLQSRPAADNRRVGGPQPLTCAICSIALFSFASLHDLIARNKGPAPLGTVQ